ncbi:hypothetical protein [Advenella mimigardefordensis]|uniref:Putative membrane protein n=1 Tax=Advenella mimigardefordensis (strain DSM 17166 / LMG 22922 / DPN7) TaxID=1247726 RepID=W0PDD9_ADVMD|nr:hypothetical protein [Advenella mimigardefordensis]AHG64889.1 putative membrane protein [Advenella mimigardefordensis DPN7]
MSNIQPKNNQNRAPLNEATLNRLIDNQARDQELKAKELAIREKEIEHQAKFASRMLDAQIGDRTSERAHIQTTVRYQLIFLGIGFVILMVFCAYALHNGKDALVEKVVTITASVAAGAFGGYGYRAYKEKPSDQEP